MGTKRRRMMNYLLKSCFNFLDIDLLFSKHSGVYLPILKADPWEVFEVTTKVLLSNSQPDNFKWSVPSDQVTDWILLKAYKMDDFRWPFARFELHPKVHCTDKKRSWVQLYQISLLDKENLSSFLSVLGSRFSNETGITLPRRMELLAACPVSSTGGVGFLRHFKWTMTLFCLMKPLWQTLYRDSVTAPFFIIW